MRFLSLLCITAGFTIATSTNTKSVHLVTLDCDGGVHFLKDTKATSVSMNISSIQKSALYWLNAVKGRLQAAKNSQGASCQLSEVDFNRRYNVMSPLMLFNRFRKNPIEYEGPNLQTGGNSNSICARQIPAKALQTDAGGRCTGFGSPMDALLKGNSIDVRVASSCTYETLSKGNGCLFQYEVPSISPTAKVQVAWDTCKNGAPFLSAYMTHDAKEGDWSDLFTPCDTKADCKQTAQCVSPSDGWESRSATSGQWTGPDFFHVLKDLHLVDKPADANSSDYYAVATQLKTIIKGVVFAARAAQKPDVRFCLPQKPNFDAEENTPLKDCKKRLDGGKEYYSCSRISSWDGVLSDGSGTKVLTTKTGYFDRLAFMPAYKNDIRRLASWSCDGVLSVTLTPNIGFVIRAPIVSNAIQAMDSFLKYLENMRANNNAGITLTELDFAVRFRVWQPLNWLYQLEAGVTRNLANFNDWLLLKKWTKGHPSIPRKDISMPATCSYKSWLAGSGCNAKLDMSKWLGTAADLHISAQACKDRPGGAVTWAIGMKSASYGDMMAPMKTCTSAADCSSDFQCRDYVFALKIPKRPGRRHAKPPANTGTRSGTPISAPGVRRSSRVCRFEFPQYKNGWPFSWPKENKWPFSWIKHGRRRYRKYEALHPWDFTDMVGYRRRRYDMWPYQCDLMDPFGGTYHVPGTLRTIKTVSAATLTDQDDWVGRYAFGCNAHVHYPSVSSKSLIARDSAGFTQWVYGSAGAKQEPAKEGTTFCYPRNSRWNVQSFTDTFATTTNGDVTTMTNLGASDVNILYTPEAPSAPAGAVVLYIESAVTLEGMTTDGFTPAVQMTFKKTIAIGLGGKVAASDVEISGYSRRALNVQYRVKVASGVDNDATKKTQEDAMKTLSAFMNGNDDNSFLATLKATAKIDGTDTQLSKVTGYKVTKQPSAVTAGKDTSSSSSSSLPAAAIAGIVIGIVVVLAIVGVVIFCVCMRKKEDKAIAGKV